MHSKKALALWSSTAVNAYLWDPDQWLFNLSYLRLFSSYTHCVPAGDKQSPVFLRSFSCLQTLSY